MMSKAVQTKRLRVIDDKIDRGRRRSEAARATVEAAEREVETLLAQRDWLAAAPVREDDEPVAADVVEPVEQGDAVVEGSAPDLAGERLTVETVADEQQQPAGRGSLFDPVR